VTPHARKSFGQMSEEQKEKLEALDFPFEIPEELRTIPVETAFFLDVAVVSATLDTPPRFHLLLFTVCGVAGGLG